MNQKLKKKNGFPGGSMQKMEKTQGVTVNLTGNPGGSTSKDIDILNRGGGYIFFSEK